MNYIIPSAQCHPNLCEENCINTALIYVNFSLLMNSSCFEMTFQQYGAFAPVERKGGVTVNRN